MLRSMTSFGRANSLSSDGSKSITVEVKSVNNRYLDILVKAPRNYSFLEEKIKSFISENGITRGKIEVAVNINFLVKSGSVISLDEDVTSSYIDALYKLRDKYCLKDDISVMSVAQNNSLFLFSTPEEDIDKEWNDIKPVLSSALEIFKKSRLDEGKRLEKDIFKKIEEINNIAEQIKDYSEEDISVYPEKLKQRISKILDDCDIEIADQRILTEAAIFADRVCIDEELVRLSSHFNAFKKITDSPSPEGKKLDFLMQEINREANTIASKASDSRIAHLVVDIKAILEKIREQIQNIE